MFEIGIPCIPHRRGLSSLPVFQYIEAWKQVLQQQQAAEEDVDCGAQTA